MTPTKLLLALALALPGFCAPLRAAPIFPERNRRAVVDEAHVLTQAQQAALSARVLRYVAATHHQLVVATVPTLQGYDVKTYGYQLLRTWGLGDAERNDGAILLLSTNPREVRIEVGYGLEPVLTDALTSVILQTRVVPKLKAGDVAGGLADGADAIMAATGGEDAQSPPAEQIADVSTKAEPIPVDPSVQTQGGSFEDWRDTLFQLAILALVAAAIWVWGNTGSRRGRFGRGSRTGSSSLFGGSSFSTSSSSSYSSSSSSSGFDGGGGSAGGGGSDSSW